MKLIPTLCFVLYITTMMTAVYGSVECKEILPPNSFYVLVKIKSILYHDIFNKLLAFDSTIQLGIQASWEDFQARHIAATVPANPQAWNQLLCDRIQTQFGNKTFNSFIASAVNVVASNFPNGVPQVNEFWFCSGDVKMLIGKKLSKIFVPRDPTMLKNK